MSCIIRLREAKACRLAVVGLGVLVLVLVALCSGCRSSTPVVVEQNQYSCSIEHVTGPSGAGGFEVKCVERANGHQIDTGGTGAGDSPVDVDGLKLPGTSMLQMDVSDQRRVARFSSSHVGSNLLN